MADETKRMIIKKGTGIPTIPISSDHRNGDWIATDIYDGEFYKDSDTGIVYNRSGVSIIKSGSVPNETVVLKFRVHQSGVSIPIVITYFNPSNFTLTTVRDAAGIYRVQGLVGELMATTTEKYEIIWNTNGLLGGSSVDIGPSTDEDLLLRTYDNTGTLGDNIINEFSGGTTASWSVVTVIKYS